MAVMADLESQGGGSWSIDHVDDCTLVIYLYRSVLVSTCTILSYFYHIPQRSKAHAHLQTTGISFAQK